MRDGLDQGPLNTYSVSTMDDLDLVSPDVAQLIQLFSAQVDLKFPGLDAKVLQESLVGLREQHAELLRAEAAVAAAKAAMDEQQEALLRKTHRAHAYLKVFAETDPALLAKVEAIALPRLRRPAPVAVVTADGVAPEPRKRGRPRKVQPTGESLFGATP